MDNIKNLELVEGERFICSKCGACACEECFKSKCRFCGTSSLRIKQIREGIGTSWKNEERKD